MSQRPWLIYGASGYTGELLARLAAERGERPILAARGESVRRLATELGFEARVFALDEPGAIDAGLEGIGAVVHCAGPFSRTSKPIADACLRTRTHYLDITGEIGVFEALAARDAEAKAAGEMLLPGVGFDVVPSDCLAAHLERRLPTARRLVLAFHSSGRPSHGTATTMLENLHRGGAVRRAGRLTPVPAAWRTRRFDFGRGERLAMTIPWGDVSTAFHSTGIPEIEVYMAARPSLVTMLRLARPFLPLLRVKRLQALLKSRIGAGGPSAQNRARSECRLYGEVEDPTGRRTVSRLRTPDGYTTTIHAALLCVRKVLARDVAPGFKTPSLAFGPDFVLGIEGVTREDL